MIIYVNIFSRPAAKLYQHIMFKIQLTKKLLDTIQNQNKQLRIMIGGI